MDNHAKYLADQINALADQFEIEQLSGDHGVRPLDGYFHYQMLVTPEIAAAWLATQKRNRPLHPRVVNRYASEMASGQWRRTGDPIKFDKDGNLIDGQHRLNAVIRAGTSVLMDIVTGIEPEAQNYMDRGLGRSAADTFGMLGKAQPALVAATVRLLWTYLNEGFSNESSMYVTPPNFELTKVLEEHSWVLYSVAESRRYRTASKWLTGSVVAFTHYLTSGIDDEKSQAFWGQLDSGVNLVQGNPTYVLRSRLMENFNSKSKYSKLYRMAILWKAWNNHYAGRPSYQLKWQTGGEKPEDFPTLSGYRNFNHTRG